MRLQGILIVVVVLIAAFSFAVPASAAGKVRGGKAARTGQRQAKAATGPKRGHYSFGKITSISGSTITIHPETPDFVAQRRKASTKPQRPLPESLSFAVNSETTYERKGQAVKLSDYKTGDEVAAVLTGKVRSGQGVALKLLDVDSVQQHYGKGKGLFGPRPQYGTVLSVDKSSIRIKPEVPDFIEQQREQRRAAKAAKSGLPAPVAKPHKARRLPEEESIGLNALTQYWQGSAQVTHNPFKAGDKVAIYPAVDSSAGSLTAASVSDYSTVQDKLAKRSRHAARGTKGARKAGRKGGKRRARQAAAETASASL